ncbi:MAG: hypothetical protein AB1540_06700 [Bdellovibrionota bacterium]
MQLALHPHTVHAEESTCLWRTLFQFVDLNNQGFTLEKLPNSTDHHEILRLLESEGGSGQVVRVVTHDNTEFSILKNTYVEILSPPEKLLGSNFKKIFERLKENHIPVLLDPSTPFFEGGRVIANRPFQKGSQTLVVLNPRGALRSATVTRHEFQHVLDLTLEPDAFVESLPRLPHSIAKLIRKRVDEPLLSENESKRLQKVADSVWAMLEARASERSVTALFKKEGLREIFLTNNMARELYNVLMTELFNISHRNVQILYSRIWFDPLNPNNLLVCLKIGASTTAFVIITLSPDLAFTGIYALIKTQVKEESEEEKELHEN